MLLPELFGDSFFDDFMTPWNTRYYRSADKTPAKMNTDVRETENTYEVDMELPGFKKEDVQAELKDGYLTVTASRTENNDEKNAEGKYVRRERYNGSYSRSFFVGENVEQTDIQARFEDGILKLSIPKNVEKKVEEKKLIAIEG